MKKFLIGLLVLTLTGCESNKYIIDTDIIIENNLEISISQIPNGSNQIIEYFDINDRKVYLVGLSEVNLKENGKIVMTLKHRFLNINKTFNSSVADITSKLKVHDILKDGGTTIYKGNNFTLIRCNTLSGNKDIYIGNGSLQFREFFCKR